MMKRIAAILLALTVLLTLTPVLAEDSFQITSMETKENGNVLVQWTDPSDGKTYTLVGFDEWTLEQPDGFLATMIYNTQNDGGDSKYKHHLLMMDEQGNISEYHGNFEYSFRFYLKDNTYRQDDSTNLRVVTIPDERRQQIV